MATDVDPPPKIALGDDTMVLGTLNCLGEAVNPFEFLSETNFSGCTELQKAADELTYEGFTEKCTADVLEGAAPPGGAEALARLKEHCDGGKHLWEFFDEPTLHSDNKLLSQRLNMITFSMKADGGAAPQWTLLETWTTAFATLAPTSETYAKDANLWLWDLACNCVAASEPDAFKGICQSTYLNPSNFKACAQAFWKAAADVAAGRPLVLGLQEWPSGETGKGEAFRSVLESSEFDMQVVAGDVSVAIAYKGMGLGKATLLDTSAAKEVMQQLLDEYEARGEGLDAKMAKGCLDTTARKTMAVRFPDAPAPIAALTFVNIHAKEPKTAAAAKLLADYTVRVGARAAGGDAAPRLVAFLDANTAKQPIAEAFAAQLATHELETLPGSKVDTTAKMRSRLHGQTYDKNKCMKVVRAPKDALVAPTGLMSAPVITPDIKTLCSTALPSDIWASDHALSLATLACK